ncbi:D-2-hydroxyacid dehydrogenase [Chitinophaga pendula]|uniref:D-2-hydroxyacid dehydrogenase n=1 Tax=Chitinophaga TaxID=79328 RepID=UPI000BAEFA83|nr:MULTISPECIES: D-2-hydroxyacid dehydrogenase [Chitinophaga]ASZ11336.1 glycerate dehydrogenase [Chitinophaga sp. MD30]UCJ05662.1 D-2-hydroxyacid dehydrogenase [Chitinophaga pendula]
MKKIVVLDGYTLNPGDLDWQYLHQLGKVEIYDRTPPELVAARAAGAEIVLTNKSLLSAATIAFLPALRYIGVMATGYNVVDIAAAKKAGIIVTNVPAYGTATVAQFTFALILELCHHVGIHDQSVKAGDWSRQPDFSYWKTPMMELAGKVLGIVGLGKIGQAVAAIAQVFGMKVIAHHRHPERDALEGITFASLDDCFRQSDFISLHCPLKADNYEFVNKGLLQIMKPTAYLINTSRGPLIREQDLADALNEGIIAGAALDVLSIEPPQAGHPLLSAKNCLLTPHIAWATREARQRLLNTVVDNLDSFIAGQVKNQITM